MSDNYYVRLAEQLKTQHYNVPASEARDAILNLWNIVEGTMHPTVEIVTIEGEQRGVLHFSDMRMTWRAINRRGNVAYFSTREDAKAWLVSQPPLGYRAANGNASGS